MTHVFRISMLWLLVTLVLSPCSSPTAAQGSAPAALFRPEEIEQLVAPIALYPDALLAQILMASTYPLEVVEAARWAKANPKLKDQALADAVQKQPWDASVKSLTAFPQVLTMMNEKLDLTQKLGDACLAQQKDVMDAIQRLRAKAQAQGSLKTTPQQRVIVEEPPALQTTQQEVIVEQPSVSQTTVIRIEPADPQVVYVPTYNPTAVYGGWPYPAYPPYAYYPPGYAATTAVTSLLSFGAGMAVGSALWGDFDWGHGDVDVNVNRYNSFNKTNITSGKWEHNVQHRKGVQYRDSVSQQKYNRATRTGGDGREAFRGRAESGQRELARGGDEIRRDLEKGRVGAERGRVEGGRGDAERGRPGAESRDRPEARRTPDLPDRDRTASRQTGQERRQIGQEPRKSGARERQGLERTHQASAFQGVGKGSRGTSR